MHEYAYTNVRIVEAIGSSRRTHLEPYNMTSDHEQFKGPAHMFSWLIGRRCQSILPTSVFVIALRPLKLLPNANLVIIAGIVMHMPWSVMERSPYGEDVTQIQDSVRG